MDVPSVKRALTGCSIGWTLEGNLNANANGTNVQLHLLFFFFPVTDFFEVNAKPFFLPGSRPLPLFTLSPFDFRGEAFAKCKMQSALTAEHFLLHSFV